MFILDRQHDQLYVNAWKGLSLISNYTVVDNFNNYFCNEINDDILPIVNVFHFFLILF